MNKCVTKTLVFLLIMAFGVKDYCVFAENNAGTKNEYFESIKDAMDCYKSGIDSLLKDIPDNIQDTNDPYFVFSVLKSSVYSRLHWGKIKPDGGMIALSKGSKSGCWAMFYDKDHPGLQKEGPTLKTQEGGGIIYIGIKPYLITQKWAGLFLFHDFLYAYRRLSGQNSGAELNGYLATKNEKFANNYLSKGKFNEVLEDILKENNLKKQEDFLNLIRSDYSELLKLLQNIDSRMGEKKPLSSAEVQMRFGLYSQSLSLQLSENLGEDQSTQISNLVEIKKLVSR